MSLGSAPAVKAVTMEVSNPLSELLWVTSPALIQLRALQQSLYDKAYQEAHSIVGGSSRAILAYSEKFERSLPRRFTRTNQLELLEALKRHRFVLYGDFHTLRQSQRGLLRLLRAYVEKQKTNKVVIALEMFKAVDQDDLDGYLAGRIPEDQFLEGVNYRGEWGFPWANFKMILDFARARKLPVVGINSENAGRDTLALRDRFAAQQLADAADRYPDHRIVCLIGEYHLADAHLPKALGAELKRRGSKGTLLRILNNVDQYYFQLSRETSHASTEHLRLRKDFFCIMNTPPWMKWQSFSIWEEMRHGGHAAAVEPDGEMELDPYNEEAFDVDYQFLHFVRNLASFMSLNIDASDMESFHIHFSPDGDFLRDLTRDGTVTVAEAGRMVGRASVDGVYFLSRANTVLLTDISINNLAEAAGQYLHRLLTGFDDGALPSTSAAEEFYRRLLKSAVGMVASKILNPRRKCRELHHYRQLVRPAVKGRPGATADKRQTASAILRFDRWLTLRLAGEEPDAVVAPPRPIIQLDHETNFEVSRCIGQMLGVALYKKVIANKQPASKIRRLFKRQIGEPAALWAEVHQLYRLMKP